MNKTTIYRDKLSPDLKQFGAPVPTSQINIMEDKRRIIKKNHKKWRKHASKNEILDSEKGGGGTSNNDDLMHIVKHQSSNNRSVSRSPADMSRDTRSKLMTDSNVHEQSHAHDMKHKFPLNLP